jgi:AcrR family transcriptional regulator
MAGTTRERLLAAAERAYAAQGFAGTTTRQVAAEAGVHEVTLFRQFGTKERLVEAVIRRRMEASPVPSLEHGDAPPEEALADWCRAHLARLHGARGVMRQFLAEKDQPSRLDAPTCAGLDHAADELRSFLRRNGLTSSAETDAAIAMLVSTLMVDALARQDYPGAFALHADAAGAAYADRFLAMVGGVPAG